MHGRFCETPPGGFVTDDADLPALVRAARGGDEAAFRALYRAVQPGLLRYLRVLVGDDGEDLASEQPSLSWWPRSGQRISLPFAHNGDC